MELQDIIREDRDRLFIIDRECYLVFTGTTLEDEKPFIRIGTSIDLPVEIIPLIDTVAITEPPVGNPALEQLNIDLTAPLATRYIGSRETVMPYLNLQRLFGLDLESAPVTDVEKDIPTFSGKTLNNNDSFAGIFYTDGNFRIYRGNTTILDLHDIKKTAIDDITVLDTVSREGNAQHYRGNGLVILDRASLFYRNGHFLSYGFPRSYHTCNTLSIDIGAIDDMLLPAPDLLTLLPFLRWKELHRGQLSIYCDHGEADYLTQLFPGLSIRSGSFRGLAADTGAGLTVQNDSGTVNLKLTYRAIEPKGTDLTIAYVQDQRDIERILKEKLDGIFITYSTYEKTNLLFKSAKTPFAIIDDGNANVLRLPGDNPPVIYRDIPYELKRYDTFDELLQDLSSLQPLAEIGPLLYAGDITALQHYSERYAGDAPIDTVPLQLELYNFLSALRALLEVTGSRKHAQVARRLITDLSPLLDRRKTVAAAASPFIILGFLEHSIHSFIGLKAQPRRASRLIEVIEKGGAPYDIPDPEKREFFLRMQKDRKRLEELVRLFQREMNEEQYRKLSEAFDERKRRYFEEALITLPPPKQQRRIFRKVAIAFIIVAAALVLAISLKGGIEYYHLYREQALREASEKRRGELISRYDIRVTDRDIFTYANDVAVKNGYQRIMSKRFRGKNPHWIFPGITITMLDGEERTVVQGDTLWEIAKEKVMGIHLAFYEIVSRIEKRRKAGEDVTGDLERLRALAYTEKHREILQQLTEKPNTAHERE